MRKLVSVYWAYAIAGVAWLAFCLWVLNTGHFLQGLSLIALLAGSAGVVYWKFSVAPRQRIETIRQLAIEISEQMQDNPKLIATDRLPSEIKPVVAALNELLHFYGDRYRQEREFTADASHELRTPLAGIRLQTQLAMMTEDAEQRNNAHKNILKSVDRGTRLVEQLLVLSRLTMDNLELDIAEVELVELIQQVIEGLQPHALQKQITISFAPPSKACVLPASAGSLEILFDNIIRNALNFTFSGGQIHVALMNGLDGYAQIIIADNGPGIPEADRNKVFQRFQKASSSGKGGTGLGLAIVKRIVDLHDGRVSLGFTSGQTGLTVRVKLPLKPDSSQETSLLEKIQQPTNPGFNNKDLNAQLAR